MPRASVETAAEGSGVVAYFEPRREGCCEGRGRSVAAAVEDLRGSWLEAVDEALSRVGCEALGADKAASVWDRELTLEEAVREAEEKHWQRQLAEAPDLHMQPDWYQRAHADEMRRG